MVWSAATQPGPLLSSTISAMELDDRGQFMKLIPSLNGKLYKFNGEVSLVESVLGWKFWIQIPSMWSP